MITRPTNTPPASHHNTRQHRPLATRRSRARYAAAPIASALALLLALFALATPQAALAQNAGADDTTDANAQQPPGPTDDHDDNATDDAGQRQPVTVGGSPATTPDSPDADSDAPLTLGLAARVQGAVDDPLPPAIGSLDYTPPADFDPTTDYLLHIQPSWWGMGLERATLPRHFDTVAAHEAAQRDPDEADQQYVVQNAIDGDGFRFRAFSMIFLQMSVGPRDLELVNLFGSSRTGRFWARDPDHPHRYIAEIAADGGQGETIARVIREFELDPGTYELVVRQRVVNLTDEKLFIRAWQDGPLNLAMDTSGYRIELRRLRLGWINPTLEARQGIEEVQRDDELRAMQWGVNRMTGNFTAGDEIVWPAPKVWDTQAQDLSWLAQTDRFFAAAMHALVQDPPPAPLHADQLVGPDTSSKRLRLADRLILEAPYVPQQELPWTLGNSMDQRYRLAVRAVSRGFEVPPGAELNLDFGVYIGPLDRSTLKENVDPRVAAVNLDGLVVYSLGSFLACCTFPWLGELLLVLLRFFHSFTFDWAVSIILLVVLVRTVLHPITKKSQVSMLRFGKKMQKLAPKQKKIQEKYKDDRKKLQEEMTKLMREEGVNPAGALGCLPMFLQTPIWIALYAMLYMNFELRHEGAFYGFFQSITGGNWTFLADLSRGDSLIPLPQSVHFTIPLMGTIAALNIIPLLMGVLFYIQQKYMTPPPSTELSPEMQTQQKLMKVMLVVMFPIFMYNAPAALTLYFITNSTLGILESRYIRNHVDQLELEMEEHGVKSVRQLKKKKAASRVAQRSVSQPRDRFKKRK
jgi:YidC/Oxa1 family membrane protein insertase